MTNIYAHHAMPFVTGLSRTLSGFNLQESTNELVRHCGPRFFSLPLPGATMLMLDFIHAANTITATGDLKQVGLRLLSYVTFFVQLDVILFNVLSGFKKKPVLDALSH